jgi:hypothetical protein
MLLKIKRFVDDDDDDNQLYLLQLTQTCKKALVRIFKICDSDSDGLLNDYELNAFQVLIIIFEYID